MVGFHVCLTHGFMYFSNNRNTCLFYNHHNILF